jgi:hypothetical protein
LSFTNWSFPMRLLLLIGLCSVLTGCISIF